MVKPKLWKIIFGKFRKEIIGVEKFFDTPYGAKKIIYADWTASGRYMAPIERKLMRNW